MGWVRLHLVALAAVWAVHMPAKAQDFAPSLPFSPAQSPIGIVVIDLERLFTESNYGARVRELVAAQNAALEAEDAVLYAELEAEVAILTQKRQEMSPEDFRVEARAFDEKVTEIRAMQDKKQAELKNLIANSDDRFVAAIQPLLDRLRVERGALLLLDQQMVRIADPSIDITDVAISAVNEAMVSGTLQVPESADLDEINK